MSPAPIVGSFGLALYDACAPMAQEDEANGWGLLMLCGALAAPFEKIYAWVMDDEGGRPGWSPIVDLNRAPSEGLPWIAQLVGTRLTYGMSDADARARIASTDGMKRGGVDAIKGAPLPYLTGAKTVIVRERFGGGDSLVVARNRLPVNTASIETSAAGWTASANCTIARTTGVSIDGSASLAMTATAAGNMRAVTALLTVQDALEHIGRIEFRSGSVARRVGVYLEWFNAAGSYIGGGYSGSFPLDNASGWTLATDAGIIPAGAVRASIEATVTDCAAGEVHYIDRAGLFAGANPAWTNTDRAYQISVTTYTSQTPDQAKVAAALLLQKPGGVVMTYQVAAGQDLQSVSNNHATLQSIADSFTTLQAVADAQPTT